MLLLYQKILNHVSIKLRRKMIATLLLAILASFFEVISLGSVVPFLAVILSPDTIFDINIVAKLAHYISISRGDNINATISLVFISAAILSGYLRVLLLKANIDLTNGISAQLSHRTYSVVLSQNYLSHVKGNTSNVISGTTQKVDEAANTISAGVSIITNLILMVSILGVLVAINPYIAGSAIFSLGGAYFSLSMLSKRRLTENSKIVAKEQSALVRITQESLGSIRDVIIDDKRAYFSDLYLKSVVSLRHAIASNQFIALAPRYFMEAITLVLIGTITVMMSEDPTMIANMIPVLGALALGAQRLLPLLQQLYGKLSFVRGAKKSLEDVLDLLDCELLLPPDNCKGSELEFNRHIELRNVCFSYNEGDREVLSKINMKIRKGEKIGFIGETGVGKTTILDIILGLIQPTAGQLLVDNVKIDRGNTSAWQRKLTHVPQQIYLSDTTIAENIAFGIPPKLIDYSKVKQVSELAWISDFINNSADHYKTNVGEGGLKLSGGQRQRIGIARALYSNPQVLILDEATSALDSLTESRVMKSISKLDDNITMFIIAHRTETLKICDRIYELKLSGECIEHLTI